MKRLKEKPWFNYTIAACIAVILYVVLTHLSGVRDGIRTLLGYFKPVILGCVIAYLINPLSKLYSRSVFRRIKKEKTREAVFKAVASENTKLPSDVIDDNSTHNGTGLISVFLRLQLQFHRYDLFDITNGDNGEGTKFIIRIPKHV